LRIDVGYSCDPYCNGEVYGVIELLAPDGSSYWGSSLKTPERHQECMIEDWGDNLRLARQRNRPDG
jgi:hypothetical protein